MNTLQQELMHTFSTPWHPMQTFLVSSMSFYRLLTCSPSALAVGLVCRAGVLPVLDGPELLRAGLGRLPPAAIIVRGCWMYPLLLLLDGTGGRGTLAGAKGCGTLAERNMPNLVRSSNGSGLGIRGKLGIDVVLRLASRAI